MRLLHIPDTTICIRIDAMINKILLEGRIVGRGFLRS